ncbi:MAG TPA: sulfotransferase [Solirubrobacterales bacterium]|nr:sulfotransferase [Solirubrobacterales bacterium]
MSRALPLWKRPLAAASRARRRISEEPRAPAPFVVGVNRSGTTLLRLMLDSHPEMTIPPETHFVPEMIRLARRDNTTRKRLVRAATDHPRWGDFGLDEGVLLERLQAVKPLDPAGALRAFYDLYAEKEGKPRWGDKTPRYMRAMPRIERALPEARFIHLIRDGRDVALSQAERALDGEAPELAEVAERWRRRIETARVHSADLDHYLEVRYEDLVGTPDRTLRGICDFIELPYDDAMLSYHERAAERLTEMDRDLGSPDKGPVRTGDERLAGHAMTAEPPTTDRCGRWREEMAAADVAEFERVAGSLLEDLGYELSASVGSHPGGDESR